QVRYNDTGFAIFGMVHNTLIPSFAFTNPSGFQVSWQAFHITWTGVSLGVNNVQYNELGQVKAYPNPANNMLHITYVAEQGANATVTLTNVIGEVVDTKSVTTGAATFNTATLPAGVYLYNIEVNGQHTTGRVVVAH